MNIDDIKRNLNKRTNLNQAPAPREIVSDMDYDGDVIMHSTVPKKYDAMKEHKLVNNMFDGDSEEEKEPQSEVWVTDVEELDVRKPIRMTVEDLHLDDNVYDWRHSTGKGRKSHKNFTNFLRETL